MGLFRVTTILLISVSILLRADTEAIKQPHFDKRHILYLMSTNKTSEAIDQYLTYYRITKKHDLKILEQLGNIILDSGAASKDLEDQLLTIFGIGLSGSRSSLHFLESAMKSRFPAVQAAAINLLANIHEDVADDIIAVGLKSDFLIIRVEALYHLVSRKAPNALGHVEGLCNLLHPQFRPFFVEFYALHGSNEAIRHLKMMVNDKDMNVRLAAIAAIANFQRDDLLSSIRSTITHSDPALKEASAFALGSLRDLNSIEQLKLASLSPFTETKLAALHSLYKLGDSNARAEILKLAEDGNPFAIQIASDLTGSQESLRKLLLHEDNTPRLNAALSLLKLRDKKVVPVIIDLLNANPEFISFIPFVSPGRSLVAWKSVATAVMPTEDLKRNLMAITINFQEELLRQCIDLPEQSFLHIAKLLFQGKSNKLIPLLVSLLENIQSIEAKELLQEHARKVGSPLVRGYCNLALYRLNSGQEQRMHFFNWMSTQKGIQLIEFKPMMDRGAREDSNASNYTLSPEEQSGLLIESFAAIASKHDIQGIEFMLEAIRDGHEKNRYAFAGLLLRAIQ